MFVEGLLLKTYSGEDLIWLSLDFHFHTREYPKIVIITIQTTSNWLPFPSDFSPKCQLLSQEVFSIMISTTRAMNWAQNSFLTRTLKMGSLCTWWHTVFRFLLWQGKGIHCPHLASKKAVPFLLLITEIASKRCTTELYYIQLNILLQIKKSLQHYILYF